MLASVHCLLGCGVDDVPVSIPVFLEHILTFSRRFRFDNNDRRKGDESMRDQLGESGYEGPSTGNNAFGQQ